MTNIFSSKIKLSIKGRHIERFIKKLSLENINLYKIEKISYNEINIVIKKDDYDKVLKLKTIYECSIIGGSGFIKIRKMIKVNSLLISFFFIAFFFILFLSRMIFNIDIIHTDSSMRKFILNELEIRGIKPFTLKKSFNELQNIKEDILSKYKDKIEWLEIEELGTNYIVRIEERKITSIEENNEKQNVIAKKDAIIKKIEAKSGQIVKEINSYVKKGDIIISGNITLNDEIKNTVHAEGNVYGEVWYKINVSYPLFYQEEKDTGYKRKGIVIHFLNHNFSFNNKKMVTIESKQIYKSSFFPFSITYNQEKEVEIIDEVYTIDEAIKKAEEKGISEISSKLNDNEKIIETKNLKVDIKDSKIELEMFIVAYENITDYALIVEE